MNARQQRFIEEYLVDLNGTQAAIRAGYAEKGAAVQAHTLLRNPKIRAKIEDAKIELSKRTKVTQDRVIHRLAEIGFADMGDFMRVTETGEAVLDLTAITPAQSAAIQEITTEVYMEGKGDEAERVKRVKLKLHPPIPALQLLGKHLGSFVDRLQVGSDVNLHVHAPKGKK